MTTSALKAPQRRRAAPPPPVRRAAASTTISRRKQAENKHVLATVCGIVLLCVALSFGVYFVQHVDRNSASSSGSEAEANTASLIRQIESAATRTVHGANVFGGRVDSVDDNGRHAVKATNIPNRACVDAAWKLAQEGNITINGVYSPHLTASKLVNMCSEGEDHSVMLWFKRAFSPQ